MEMKKIWTNERMANDGIRKILSLLSNVKQNVFLIILCWCMLFWIIIKLPNGWREMIEKGTKTIKCGRWFGYLAIKSNWLYNLHMHLLINWNNYFFACDLVIDTDSTIWLLMSLCFGWWIWKVSIQKWFSEKR